MRRTTPQRKTRNSFCGGVRRIDYSHSPQSPLISINGHFCHQNQIQSKGRIESGSCVRMAAIGKVLGGYKLPQGKSCYLFPGLWLWLWLLLCFLSFFFSYIFIFLYSCFSLYFPSVSIEISN